MVFSSIVFLFYFLPLCLLFYYICPRRFRNFVLLCFSLTFYAWGEPVYIVLMVFSSVIDYIHGILIHKHRKTNIAKLFVASSIIINLSLLIFFKYADFFILNINSYLGTSVAMLNLPLPIGISFYTFQTMSYSIDVYRGDAPVQKNPIALATYVSLFPQLIAGPIVRYQTIAHQIVHRKESIDQFSQGVQRFIKGLGKKVLLANNIGFLWDQIQSMGIGSLSVMSAWLGIVAFGFQIYFDFSGYSDMAIGLGKMFGFDFLENFNYPYISQSISEFWRRWHISLGSWFRDYLYIPLGGNRGGKLKLYRNLFIVWLLTGFWHGANWNYIIWGLYFGVFIALERAWLLDFVNSWWRPFRHVYVILIVLISWVFFVFEDLSMVLEYLKVMFGFNKSPFIDSAFMYYLNSYAINLVILTLLATPVLTKVKLSGTFRMLSPIFNLIIILICTAYLVDSSYNPFLYFRF